MSLKTKKVKKKVNKPKLLFHIGNLQVFCYAEEQNVVGQYRNVYWQDVQLQQKFGPFPDVYSAMLSYKSVIEIPKTEPTEVPANIIKVDFKLRKRIYVESKI